MPFWAQSLGHLVWIVCITGERKEKFIENSVTFSYFIASSNIRGLGSLETNLLLLNPSIYENMELNVEYELMKTRASASSSACGSIFSLREFGFGLLVAGMNIDSVCIMTHRQYQQRKCCLSELVWGTGRLTWWWHGGNELQHCYSKCHCYVISISVGICSMLQNTYFQYNSSLNRFQFAQESN